MTFKKALRGWRQRSDIYKRSGVQDALGEDKVVYMGDSFMPDYGADGRIDQATSEALDADVVILFLGTSAINPHTVDTVSLYTCQALPDVQLYAIRDQLVHDEGCYDLQGCITMGPVRVIGLRVSI